MVTIKEVAKQAGVSVATVSRIINNQGHFSQKTIEHVQHVMKELDYQPNEVARTLGSRKSKMFALILPNKELPVFGIYTAAIEKAAYERGYRITLCSSYLDREKEKASIELLKKNMADGIIYGGFNTDVSNFQNADIPAVTIGRKVSDQIPVIQADNLMAGKLAYNHLCARGCSKILYLTGYPGGILLDEKYQGIREMEMQKKIPCYSYEISLEMQLNYTMDSVVNQALLDVPDADGIIAETDLIAMKCIQVCCGMGYDVPQRMKIIGFGNHFYSMYTNPPITTIYEPIEQIAYKAVEQLIKVIGKENEVQDIVIPVALVERKTT